MLIDLSIYLLSEIDSIKHQLAALKVLRPKIAAPRAVVDVSAGAVAEVATEEEIKDQGAVTNEENVADMATD